MRYLYGASDEKFVKASIEEEEKVTNPLQQYKYKIQSFLQPVPEFNKNDVPIGFKVTPDTLLNLCSKVVDSFKLPSIYEWTNKEVCNWIYKYGYHHYQNTFRENLITGRKLLLIDAQALSDMNIKNFDDIKHIAYGIRQLFFFEMTKFMNSISLPPQYHTELYKLFMVKSGRRYAVTRRTDLWRQMQSIRPKCENLSHWELLERWLALEPERKNEEVIGSAHRYRLYGCKPAPPTSTPPAEAPLECTCIPPCSCYWTEAHVSEPTVFSMLRNRKPDQDFRSSCEGCMPPCTCHWSSSKYSFGTVLSCLQMSFPHKYGPLRFNRFPYRSNMNLSINDFP